MTTCQKCGGWPCAPHEEICFRCFREAVLKKAPVMDALPTWPTSDDLHAAWERVTLPKPRVH
jgi:hypothetical protein